MTVDSEKSGWTRHLRLYVGIVVFAIVALGLALLAVNGGEGEADSSVTAEKPPMPRTKVQLTENKLIEQQALDLDASLKLSTAHGNVATTHEE